MVKSGGNPSTMCKRMTRRQGWGKDPNATVESQEGIAKSNKKSVASNGASKEDAKAPAKAQEDSNAKKYQ
eukprot:9474846-Ditylum_brightwellii.AAC.1